MPQIILDPMTYSRLMDAFLAVSLNAGVAQDADPFKIALGEIAGIWPESLLASFDERDFAAGVTCHSAGPTGADSSNMLKISAATLHVDDEGGWIEANDAEIAKMIAAGHYTQADVDEAWQEFGLHKRGEIQRLPQELFQSWKSPIDGRRFLPGEMPREHSGEIDSESFYRK